MQANSRTVQIINLILYDIVYLLNTIQIQMSIIT